MQVLKQKLKKLKGSVKKQEFWHFFGNIHLATKEVAQKVNDVQSLSQQQGFSNELFALEITARLILD